MNFTCKKRRPVKKKKSIEILLDIVFNPLIENGGFKAEYERAKKK